MLDERNRRVVATWFVLATAVGCSSESTPSGPSTGAYVGPTSGPGATTGDTGSGAGPSSIAPDALGDAIYIENTDISNVALGGTSCGAFDMTVNCPTGGTVAISGSSQNCPTAGGSGSFNASYTFEMTDCEDVANGITVTLNGTATRSYTETLVNGTETTEVTNLQATSDVSIKATESGFADFAQSCTFGMTFNLDSSGKTLTGSVCDMSFTDMF